MPGKFVIPTPKPGPYGLGPNSQRKPGVPQGTVTKAEWRSTIFPGTIREYWVYVPMQYTPDEPASSGRILFDKRVEMVYFLYSYGF